MRPQSDNYSGMYEDLTITYDGIFFRAEWQPEQYWICDCDLFYLKMRPDPTQKKRVSFAFRRRKHTQDINVQLVRDKLLDEARAVVTDLARKAN